MRSKDEDRDFIFAGNYAYVPDDAYEAVYTKWSKSEFYGNKKIYLWFQIIHGQYQGTKIFMPFNLHKSIRRGCKYYAAWVLANGGIKPKANNRLSPKVFENKVFSIKTRTVIKGRKQESLDSDEKYSVVDELIGISVGK